MGSVPLGSVPTRKGSVPYLPNAALDVKNVLWLLAAMLFVIAPHALRLAEWVGTFFVLVVVWRGWIALRAARFPPRWLVVALTLGAVAATFLAYGRIMGRDAGTTLLILMSAMKLLEMKTSREVVLAIHLGFILVMTNFLFSQTIPLGIYMLACVWLFVGTLVGFHRGVGRTPTVRERLVPSGMLLLQAVPLMVVFFILFPRVQGPLWALPAGRARRPHRAVGHDDAGEHLQADPVRGHRLPRAVRGRHAALCVALLARPGAVVLRRAHLEGPEFTPSAKLNYTVAQRPVHYAVTVEPHGKHWLFALDVPGTCPRGVGLRHDLQLRSVSE